MADFDTSIIISTAATAIFAGIMTILAIRKYFESNPIITITDKGGDKSRPYQNILIKLQEPDDKKYYLHKVKIIEPFEAMISDPNSQNQSNWSKSIIVPLNKNFISLRIQSARGKLVKAKISASLRSSNQTKHVTVITKMNN